jgi:hypothetical protein
MSEHKCTTLTCNVPRTDMLMFKIGEVEVPDPVMDAQYCELSTVRFQIIHPKSVVGHFQTKSL